AMAGRRSRGPTRHSSRQSCLRRARGLIHSLGVMNGPLLAFSSDTAEDFVRQLICTNIRVPRVGDGRTSQHRERYVMARFLATAYTQGLIDVPISINHRDNTGNPDFLLSFGGTEIGAECVEVVPQEWYAIEAIRRRDFPGAMTFSHRFEPREH